MDATDTADTADRTDPADVPIGIGLRTHERQQLEEMVPAALDYMRDMGLDPEADDLDNVTIEYEHVVADGEFSYRAFASPAEWRSIVSGLGKVRHEYGLKLWWLRKKLSARLREVTEDADAA